jgi:hypothetical protein
MRVSNKLIERLENNEVLLGMQCFTSNHTLIEVLGVTGFDYGKTTAVVDAQTYKVQAVLNTGPRTNHPNFVTVDGVNYAYLTVGDLGPDPRLSALEHRWAADAGQAHPPPRSRSARYLAQPGQHPHVRGAAVLRRS